MSQDITRRLARFKGQGFSAIDAAISSAESAITTNSPVKTSFFNNFGGAKTALAQAELLDKVLSAGCESIPTVLDYFMHQGLNVGDESQCAGAVLDVRVAAHFERLIFKAFTSETMLNKEAPVPFLDSAALAREMTNEATIAHLRGFALRQGAVPNDRRAL
jgi:hypothetical protein